MTSHQTFPLGHLPQLVLLPNLPFISVVLSPINVLPTGCFHCPNAQAHLVAMRQQRPRFLKVDLRTISHSIRRTFREKTQEVIGHMAR